eukprot:4926845-Prorocentrum_lima.AAC.1
MADSRGSGSGANNQVEVDGLQKEVGPTKEQVEIAGDKVAKLPVLNDDEEVFGDKGVTTGSE